MKIAYRGGLISEQAFRMGGQNFSARYPRGGGKNIACRFRRGGKFGVHAILIFDCSLRVTNFALRPCVTNVDQLFGEKPPIRHGYEAASASASASWFRKLKALASASAS